MDKNFFDYAIPTATMIFGYLVGWLRYKWVAEEARRAEIEKHRRPIYAESFKILCALEGSQYQPDKLAQAIANLQDWIITEATSMSPQGNNALGRVVHSARELWAVTQNNDANMSLKVNKDFNEILHKAKTFFIENEKIRWLPEDREKKKKSDR